MERKYITHPLKFFFLPDKVQFVSEGNLVNIKKIFFSAASYVKTRLNELLFKKIYRDFYFYDEEK